MADNINKNKDEVPSRIRRLLKFFNLGLKGSEVEPIRHVNQRKGNKVSKVTQFEEFPSSVQKILNYWKSQNLDTSAAYENRKMLWQDMDMVFQSSMLVARAMKLMAHETVQEDLNFRSLDVEAKPKVKDFILKFFDDIKINKFLLPTALSICKYGNAGWILSHNEFGIDEILPIDIYDLVDRIEFTPHEARKLMNDTSSLVYKMSQNTKLKMLFDDVMKTNDYSSYFKSYLFGYQIADFILPPWKFLHFRNYTSESPFFPFGVPPFLHTVSAYKQYDAALTLQIAARAARFPIYKYNLKIPNAANIVSKVESAVEFMNEWDNSGLHSTRKEELGVGERIVTLDETFTFEQETPELDLGRIDDIELMRDDLVIATGIPRNFIDAGASNGFGNSGIALMQQFKPFAREIYNVQSILLENISQLIKIHMILSGKFQDEEIDFQLIMPYPESQTDRDTIGSQSDLLTLANSVLDSISQRIVGDQNAVLPPELVKSVYTQILPYDTQRIDDWVKSALIIKGSEEGTGGGQQGAQGGFDGGGEQAPEGEGAADQPLFGGGEEEATPEAGTEETPPATPAENAPAAEAFKRKDAKQLLNETRRKLAGKPKQQLNEEIQSIILEHKQKSIRNAQIGSKHSYSSKNKSLDFDIQKLWEFKENQVMLLQEEEKRKRGRRKKNSLFNEEVHNPRPLEEDNTNILSEEETDEALNDLKTAHKGFDDLELTEVPDNLK